MARLLGFETGRGHAVSIGAVPHLPPTLTTDVIISYLKLVRRKRKTSQFSSNVQRERTRTWRRARIGTVPHLPPALTTDLIISYLMLVRQKRKTSQFSSNVQRERTRTWRGFGHGAASRLRDGEGSCGEYWDRSSPTSAQI
jgi:hypothetical protein